MVSCERRIFPDKARPGTLLDWLCGGALLWCAGGVLASADNPPEPIDTVSPRTATQGSFLADDTMEVAGRPLQRWSIDRADQRLALAEPGLRAGEPSLAAGETASRNQEIPDQVQAFSYLAIESAETHGMPRYDPADRSLAPYQVITSLHFPAWAETRIVGEPLWRWMGTFIVLIAGIVIIAWSFLLGRRWAGRKSLLGRWSGVLLPGSLVVVMPALSAIITELLRVPGIVGKGLTLSFWAVFFVALTWLVWISGTLGAENFIRAEGLNPDSIDSRIVRILVRVVTTVLAIAILVEGFYRVSHSAVPGAG